LLLVIISFNSHVILQFIIFIFVNNLILQDKKSAIREKIYHVSVKFLFMNKQCLNFYLY